ncbi:SHH [Mytilus coruscus]|uniref:SHH n=1 Tax=Mytilus coruscus TaxID=42192 RepID=A0A6J8C490_MYTCO|nr:SHH [Mytilus coruscus]
MYVITGAYIGGSLTGLVKVVNDKLANNFFEDAQTALAMKMSFLQRDASMDFLKEEENSTLKKSLSTIHSLSLNWSGGNIEKCKKSLESIQRNDWIAWVQSLEYSPVPLWSSLDLYPLHHLVSEVNKEKGTKMQMAMNLALKGRFTYESPKEDNRTNTATSNGSGGCFHEDALVILHNRTFKRMKNLSVGDTILIMDSNGILAKDEVIAWLHQVRNSKFTFLEIVHDLGKITLSPEHIIFVGKSRNPQHASSLRPGDELCFFTNDYD